MPIIQVQHRRSSLDAGQKAAIAARLTELLLQMEGGARTEGGKAFATVIFNPVDDADWWVGGRNDGHFVQPPGAFLVTVSIPEGYMNQAHKNEVHAGATAALTQVLAPEQELPAWVLVRVWCLGCCCRYHHRRPVRRLQSEKSEEVGARLLQMSWINWQVHKS